MTSKQDTKRGVVLTQAHHDFSNGMNSYSFFKVHNHATSDDLVQDTFMKTWKYLARGGKIEIMKAFLYHVLNNLIVDEYRKRKTGSLDVLLEKGFEPSVNQTEDIFNVFDGKIALLLIQDL
jgi:DNA-directed RNA polymerase specialized sigma24 family protein